MKVMKVLSGCFFALVLVFPIIVFASDSAETESYATVQLGIMKYCYIEYNDTSLPPIEVEVYDGNTEGDTTTSIKYGANFPFKITATLGWNFPQGTGAAPGEWRVTLNDNTQGNGWVGIPFTPWKLFGEWRTIGEAKVFFWEVDVNTWDIYPYGTTTHVAPGRYDDPENNVVTLQVRNIDLNTPAKTYTGGWLRISIIEWL